MAAVVSESFSHRQGARLREISRQSKSASETGQRYPTREIYPILHAPQLLRHAQFGAKFSRQRTKQRR